MMFRHSIFQMKVTLSGDSREDDHGIEEKNSDNGATDIRLSEDKAQHTMVEKMIMLNILLRSMANCMVSKMA